MISQKVYDELSKEYGAVSSWAVWEKVGETPTSNTGDMKVFERPELLDRLHNDTVFVALNASVHDDRKDSYKGSWANFHSDDNSKQRDFKLRHALVGTQFEGSYMTDVIKNHPDKNSSDVLKYCENNPETITDNIDVLRKELKTLGGKPILIALGGDAYKMLTDNLAEEYKILKMTHYSDWLNKDKLREEALALEKAINSK